MKRYIIHYHHAATGEYTNKDVGRIRATSSERAIEKHILKTFPNGDVTYGPDNKWSTIDFYKDCISAYTKRYRPKGHNK